MDIDTIAQAGQQVAQAGAVPETWVGFAYHVFDKVWGYAVSTFGGILVGWLAMNRPAWAQRKAE